MKNGNVHKRTSDRGSLHQWFDVPEWFNMTIINFDHFQIFEFTSVTSLCVTHNYVFTFKTSWNDIMWWSTNLITINDTCKHCVNVTMSLTDTAGSQFDHDLKIINFYMMFWFYHKIMYLFTKHHKMMSCGNQQVQSLPITCVNTVWVLLYP